MSLRSASVVAFVASLAAGVSAQAGAYAQCGGTGWAGATSCVSGFVCTVSNPYYSQCIPGAATSTAPASPTTSVSTPGSTSAAGGSPTSSSSAAGASPTLLPNQLWVRADEDPDFHFYLQSETLNEPGDAVIGPPSTAAQFNVVNGQLVQFTPAGTSLYAQLAPPLEGTTRMKLFFASSPATNVTWSFSGDALTATTPGYTQKQGGIWLACTDTPAATATRPNIYVNLGNFDYMTPTGCADETLNYYNGPTPVAGSG